MNLVICAEKPVAALLTVFQRNGTHRICGVTRCSIAVLKQLYCGHGLDTGVVAIVKQNATH